MLIVIRDKAQVRVLKAGREVWSARLDAIPPEQIRSVEDGKSVTRPVDRCTDAELTRAVEWQIGQK